MTYSSEFTEEDAKQIESLVEEINATFGKNMVEVCQDKDDDSYLTVFLAGEEQTDICHDTMDVFSYLKGMLDGMKNFLAPQKTFYIVKQDFSNCLTDSFFPREVILTSDYGKARERFEIAKEECKWHLKEDGDVVVKDTLDEFHLSSEKLRRWKKVSLIKAIAL